MEQIIKPQLPNFFSLVQESFNIYKAKWVILLTLFIIPFAISMFIGMASAFSIASLASKSLAFPWIILGGLIVLLIIYFTGSAWVQSAAIITVRDRVETLGIRETLRRAKPFIAPYIGVSLISALIVILGFIFFIIPGIIFLTWFLFAEYILIGENKKGIVAISKSREYVRGYFGKILLLISIAGFLMFFLMSIFESLTKNLPMGNYIYSAVSILIAPLPLIYCYLIYEHLKKIKGGTVATPTAKQKNTFAIFAVLGTIIITAITGILIYFEPQIKTYYETELTKYQSQTGAQFMPLPQNPI